MLPEPSVGVPDRAEEVHVIAEGGADLGRVHDRYDRDDGARRLDAGDSRSRRHQPYRGAARLTRRYDLCLDTKQARIDERVERAPGVEVTFVDPEVVGGRHEGEPEPENPSLAVALHGLERVERIAHAGLWLVRGRGDLCGRQRPPPKEETSDDGEERRDPVDVFARPRPARQVAADLLDGVGFAGHMYLR